MRKFVFRKIMNDAIEMIDACFAHVFAARKYKRFNVSNFAFWTLQHIVDLLFSVKHCNEECKANLSS